MSWTAFASVALFLSGLAVGTIGSVWAILFSPLGTVGRRLVLVVCASIALMSLAVGLGAGQ